MHCYARLTLALARSLAFMSLRIHTVASSAVLACSWYVLCGEAIENSVALSMSICVSGVMLMYPAAVSAPLGTAWKY